MVVLEDSTGNMASTKIDLYEDEIDELEVNIPLECGKQTSIIIRLQFQTRIKPDRAFTPEENFKNALTEKIAKSATQDKHFRRRNIARA